MDFFENMGILLQTFWFVAIPTSLVFIIQTVMTFAGVDSSDGLHADYDGDLSDGDSEFQLFSLRNLINFLLGFSWTGISFYSTISNTILLIIISISVGCLFVYLFFVIIAQVQKLAEDNSFKIENTINKIAEVYLTIPENKSGKGKVLISVNGSVHELEAMTESEKIPTGAMVRIVRIESSNILIVASI
jgi:hypothetical protein